MYIGTTIHENIAAYYRLRHDIPVLEQVWTNTESIAQVQRDLKSEGLTTVRIPTEFANGKPDILEYAPTIHPGLPVFGYEIKPLGKDGLGWMQAVREWDWYSEGLIRAGVRSSRDRSRCTAPRPARFRRQMGGRSWFRSRTRHDHLQGVEGAVGGHQST